MRRRSSARQVRALGAGHALNTSEAAHSPVARRRGGPGHNHDSDANPALLALTEAQFQRLVRAHLERTGWLVWVVPNMRMTRRGLPDLLAIHFGKPGRLLALELKTERGRIRPEQALAIAHLQTVPGIDARIVRPSSWPALRDELEEA